MHCVAKPIQVDKIVSISCFKIIIYTNYVYTYQINTLGRTQIVNRICNYVRMYFWDD